jgi:hypothetical protein
VDGGALVTVQVLVGGRGVQLGQQRHHPLADLVADRPDHLHRLPAGVRQRPVLARDWHGRALLAAAHRDQQLGALGELVGQLLRLGVGQVDADLGPRLHDLGVDMVGRSGAGRDRSQPGRGELVEERGRHLGPAGVADAGEDHRTHRRSLVGRDRAGIEGDEVTDVVEQRPDRPRHQPRVGEPADPLGGQQAGIAEGGQVEGDQALADPKRGRELADRAVPAGQQPQQPQADWVGQGPQALGDLVGPGVHAGPGGKQALSHQSQLIRPAAHRRDLAL